MSVNQLKDGRWIVRYPKGKDSTRPTTNKKYFGRGPEAESAAIEYNSSLGLRPKKTISSPLFVEIANAYLSAKHTSLTASGLSRLFYRLNGVIIPFFGDTQAHAINHAKIDDFIRHRLQTVKSITVKNDLAVVRAILRWSVSTRLIADNPMDGYCLPRADAEIIIPPSFDEVRKISACAAAHVQRAIWITYYTGIRPGESELFCLRWDHVDLESKTLTVISAAKGGLPVRMVPLGEMITSQLNDWHQVDMQTGIDHLINYRGRPVKKIKGGWKEAKRRAGITRRIRLYDLRHAFVTNLLSAGADLKSVSELAGHTTPELTMRVYQHTSNALKRQAVSLLDGLGHVPQNAPR